MCMYKYIHYMHIHKYIFFNIFKFVGDSLTITWTRKASLPVGDIDIKPFPFPMSLYTNKLYRLSISILYSLV